MEVSEAMTKYHCVGCGVELAWDGKGLFSYTCPCGATLFADENHRFAFPASLIIGLYEGRELPHIDYYLGWSNYTSEEKEAAYKFLREKGACWSWECDKCCERYLKRKRMEIKEGFLAKHIQLHPDLEKLLKA